MKKNNLVIAFVARLLMSSTFFVGTCSMAAEFSWINGEVEGPSLVINGEIKNGDYLRVLGHIADDGNRGGRFLLGGRKVIVTSQGGSVNDAIEIGKLFRDIHAHVVAVIQCSSACFFLLAGATQRGMVAEIGLHNPYVGQEVAAGMSVKPLESALKAAETKTRQVLQDFGVPNHLISQMLSHTSAEVYLPTLQDYVEFGQYSSEWNQVRVSKCDADSTYERYTYRKGLLVSGGESPPQSRSEMDAYIRYKKMIQKCENSLVGQDALRAALSHMKRNPEYLKIR